MSESDEPPRRDRWRVATTDIAGGIIETPDGEYEVTRFIGLPHERDQIRRELQLMASAPALLDAAREISTFCRRESEALSRSDPLRASRWQRAINTLEAVIAAADRPDDPAEDS